jgi:hypothetical protein
VGDGFCAKHNMSVSQLLAQFLKERMAQEDEYAAAMNRYLSRQTTIRSKKGRSPKGEQLYERRSSGRSNI